MIQRESMLSNSSYEMMYSVIQKIYTMSHETMKHQKR